MRSKLIIWSLLIIILLNTVLGFGIAPAKTKVSYEPESVKEGKFRIIVDDIPTKVMLSVDGELSEYIELDKTVMVLDERETWVDFKVHIPDVLPPGERKGEIVVFEMPDTTDDSFVTAAIAVVHQVRIDVPYPGKYVQTKLFIDNTNVNEPILFTVALGNFGKEKIDSAKATIVIKGPTNEEIIALQTNEIELTPGSEGKLTAIFQTENSGVYIAEATIEYDGIISDIVQPFNVGSKEVEIEGIDVNNFKLGQIAKLDITLRNKWNNPVYVSGNVEVYKGSKLVTKFNSIPVTIKEKSTAIMNSYWDTEGLTSGEYDLQVNIEYDGKKSEKTFSSIVSIDDILLTDYVSGRAISEGKEGRNTMLLVGVVIVLIIINIIFFTYVIKRIKNKKI